MFEIITYSTTENFGVLRAVETRFGKPWDEVRNSDYVAACPACHEAKDRLVLKSVDRPLVGRQEVCPACYRKITNQMRPRRYPQG